MGVGRGAAHLVVCVLCVCEFFLCLCFVDCRVGASNYLPLNIRRTMNPRGR
jgi:hypothetical protein